MEEEEEKHKQTMKVPHINVQKWQQAIAAAEPAAAATTRNKQARMQKWARWMALETERLNMKEIESVCARERVCV